MYTPAPFLETSPDALFGLMERHGFGLLVSSSDGVPLATHLPFLLDKQQGPQGVLLGHMARANPQWREFGQAPCMAVFSGPHAYVSPNAYELRSEQEALNVVPTWNYVAVHVYGRMEVIEDHEALLAIVRRTTAHYEQGRPSPWQVGEMNAYLEGQLSAIVGFCLHIERIEGKWKLSQNQPERRRAGVVRALQSSENENGRQIAALMREGLSEAAFSDDDLLTSFHNSALNHHQFNHRAHVRVAYLIVLQHGLPEAVRVMREGLKRLNIAHGSPNTLMRGYHETITVTYLTAIYNRCKLAAVPTTSSEFCNRHPELLDKQFPLQFYSPERLWSWEAKERYLAPDLGEQSL